MYYIFLCICKYIENGLEEYVNDNLIFEKGNGLGGKW